MNDSTLRPEVIAAIVNGYHGDPFDVLGPHKHDDGVIVRAFLPQATAVELRPLDDQHPPLLLDKVHEAGLFEAVVPGVGLPFDYRFKVVDSVSSSLLCEDAFAFPDVLGGMDEYFLAEGTHERMYDQMGAHLTEMETGTGRKQTGVHFAVWAPTALRVSVIGDFNQWDGRRHPMRFHHNSGIWNIFIPELGEGTIYKYEIKSRHMNYTVAKADPVAFHSEVRPKTASVVWRLDKHSWQDDAWMAARHQNNSLDAPINVYEVHLGSWRRKGKDGEEWLSYSELADQLVPYVKELGYTHIELLPIAEHPYDGSWGYQVTGFFAPTSRFGRPEEFMAFVDTCHQAGIGVILDWVPAHFPRDEHGLAFFDGTHLYEHADPRLGAHPDWGTLIFNYGRNEVRQFLISNALFWLDKYHIDGLRVDAVASMLYLDFSREEGEWIPNRFGGRENLEAIAFIREFNSRVHTNYPDVLTIAEESTSWPGVTQPTESGGLGFDLKWNMGWMHDTLQYMSNDPVYRAYHHGTMTFSLLYAFSERFLLPFSHDEVVHLKKSMLDKMPGDTWQRFANLRMLYGYQIAHPGKKMLFMGGEFGQWHEWTEKASLDWHLLEGGEQKHQALQRLVGQINHLYRTERAFYEAETSWDGFTWIDLHDHARSILAFARHSYPDEESGEKETILVVCNFTPVVRSGYRLGVPNEGSYQELLNSDAVEYGGSGITNNGPLASSDQPWYGQPHSVELTLPPLGIIYLKKA